MKKNRSKKKSENIQEMEVLYTPPKKEVRLRDETPESKTEDSSSCCSVQDIDIKYFQSDSSHGSSSDRDSTPPKSTSGKSQSDDGKSSASLQPSEKSSPVDQESFIKFLFGKPPLKPILKIHQEDLPQPFCSLNVPTSNEAPETLHSKTTMLLVDEEPSSGDQTSEDEEIARIGKEAPRGAPVFKESALTASLDVPKKSQASLKFPSAARLTQWACTFHEDHKFDKLFEEQYRPQLVKNRFIAQNRASAHMKVRLSNMYSLREKNKKIHLTEQNQESPNTSDEDTNEHPSSGCRCFSFCFGVIFLNLPEENEKHRQPLLACSFESASSCLIFSSEG